ncbi:MAG: tetratricopeptide repeat protein [Planctomycetota bacterium]
MIWRRPAIRMIALSCALGACSPPAAAQKAAAIEPPAKAAKYHGVLLRRPAPGYLFDRFFNAWLDEAPVADLQAFLAARADDPGTPADRLLLALFYAKRGDDVAAIGQFRETLAADPGNAAAWRQKAELEARTLNFETALADLDAAEKAGPKPDLAVEIAKLRGRLLLRSGRRDDALKAFAKLLTDNPDDEELAEDVIELQVSEDLFDQAIETAQSLIKGTRDPYRKVLRQLRLGDIHQQAGKRSKAVEVYSGTLDSAGDGSWLQREILAQIERVYRREEDVTGLKKQYEALLKAFPQRVGVRKGYARVLADAGDFDDAINQFQEILRITPGDRANREAFVQLYVRADNLAGARKQLEALIAQQPDDAELRVQAAQLAGKAKDNAAAAEAIEAYLARSDRGEYDYLRAARLLEQMELEREASAQYAALTEAFPDSAGAKEARAAFLYKTDQKPEAIALWQAAAAGDDPQQAVRVAKALAARQEHEAAYKLLVKQANRFASDGLFVGELVAEAMALKKYEEAAPWALRRVDLAESPSELDAAVVQASSLHTRGDSVAAAIATLQDAAKTPQRACLLAELLERSGDVEQADAVLTPWIERGDALAAGQRIRMARGRQDWPAAIAATKALIETPGGRKSRNVRRLVEFYDRNLQTDEALKWTEQWKRLSPGSTSPWLTQSRLLEIEGKQKEATQALRDALKLFEDATEIRSRLAMLYRATGQLDDAESLYWREYEEGADLLSKIRAAEQLARVAEQSGKTDALVAAFEQRRKANRESIEPLIALATVHRVARNPEKRLQALAAAAKLRPGDVPLLQQIARVEEQEGEWERARDTLRRAMEIDKTARTRRQLAALLLRWGSPEEGYALLMEQADSEDASAKDVEQLAAAMISAGDWDRSAELLEPYVARHPDEHRLRFLLAASLEEMGELVRAADHFAQVVEAEEPARPTAPAFAPSARNAQLDQLASIAPPGVKELLEINQLRYTVYAYRTQRNRVSSYMTSGLSLGGTAGGLLPSAHEQTRKYAAAHAAAIAELLEDSQADAVCERVARSSLPQADLLAEFGAASRRQNLPIEQLLERFPNRPEVKAYAVLSFGGQTQMLPAEFFRAAVAQFKERHPELALLTGVQGLMAHRELADMEDELIALADAIDSPAGPTMGMLCTLPQRLQRTATFGSSDLPERLKDRIQNKIVEWYPSVRGGSLYGPYLFTMVVGVTKSNDSPRDYLRLLDAEANASAPRAGGNASTATLFQSRNRGQGAAIQEPAFPPRQLTAFPAAVLGAVTQPSSSQRQIMINGINPNQPSKWSDEDLAAALPTVTNPTLKLLLANKLGDEALAEATLMEMLGMKKPTLDAYLLAAGWEAKKDDVDAAVDHLSKARYLPMSRANRRLVDSQLVALVLRQVDAEEASEDLIATGQKAALRLRRGVQQDAARKELSSALVRLGLDDEAEKLGRIGATRPSTVSRASSAVVRPSGAGNRQAVDRIRRLIDAGKRDAAARLLAGEAMATVRQIAGQRQHGSYLRQQHQKLSKRLTKYGLTNDVLSAMDPGASGNHRRFGEYADLLRALGRKEQAIAAYERALELRPREDVYRVTLIELALEDGDNAAAEKRLAELGRTGPQLLATNMMGALNDHDNALAKRLQWGEIGLALLRQISDEKTADVSWAPQLRLSLGNAMYSRAGTQPSLYQLNASRGDSKPSDDAKRRRKLHDELCEEMLAVPSLAADGFTGLLASHEAAGEAEAFDFDKLATETLLTSEQGQSNSGQYQGVRYSSRSSPTLAPQRSPGEHLVLKCFRENDWRLLDDDLLPKLRDDRKGVLALSVEGYAKLFRAPADEFAKTAAVYCVAEGVAVSPTNQQPVTLARVLEAYQMRELQVDIKPLVADLVAGSLAQGRNPMAASPLVVDFTVQLAQVESEAEVGAWLERIAEVYAGPREHRKAIIAAAYRPNHIQWGSPSSGLHGLSACLRALLGKPETLLTTIRFLHAGEVLGLVAEGENEVRSGLAAALGGSDPDDVAAFLERSGVLGDLDEDSLAWAPIDDTGEPFGKLLGAQLKRVGDKPAVLDSEPLRATPDASDGLLLARAWLGDNEALESLLTRFDDRLAAAEKWPAETRAAAAEILTAAADRSADSDSEIGKTLQWASRQRSAKTTSKVERVLKAPTLESLKVEAHRLDDWLAKTMTELAKSDPDAAADVYFKAIDLYEDAKARGTARIYFSRPASVHYLQQVTYRLDRESIETTKLMLRLLLKGDKRVTIGSSNLEQYYLRPIAKRAETFARQAKKAGGEKWSFMPPLVTWLRQSFGPEGSPVLAPGYTQFFYNQPKKTRVAVRSWLEGELKSSPDDALLADLLAACQQASASRGGSSSESDAAAQAAQKRWRDVMADPQHPLSLRVTLAGWVHNTSQKNRSQETAIALASLYNEAYESELPLASGLEGNAATNTLALLKRPVGDPGHVAGETLRKAWIKRFTKQVSGSSRLSSNGSPYESSDTNSMLRMLAACYQQQDKKSANQLLKKYSGRLNYYHEAIGMLVREGEIAEAASMLGDRWESVRVNYSYGTGVTYDAKVVENLPKLLELLGDDSMRYIAQCVVAHLNDPPEAERGDRPTKTERLQALAAGYDGAGLVGDNARNKALLLLDHDGVLELVARQLKQQAAKVDLLALAAANDNSFDRSASLVSLHGQAAAAKGDFKPALRMLKQLTSDPSGNAWRLQNSFHEHGTKLANALQKHARNAPPEQVSAAAKQLREQIGDQDSNRGWFYPQEQLIETCLVLHAEGGLAKQFGEWAKKLEGNSQRNVGGRGFATDPARLAAQGLSRENPDTFEQRAQSLARIMLVADAAGWVKVTDRMQPTVKQYGSFQNLRPFRTLFTKEELAKGVTAACEAAELSTPVLWLAGVRELESSAQYKEAAGAWEQVAKGFADNPMMSGLARLEQAMALSNGRDKPTAVEVLKELAGPDGDQLEKNLPAPELRKRYATQAKDLGMDVAGTQEKTEPKEATEPNQQADTQSPAPAPSTPADSPAPPLITTPPTNAASPANAAPPIPPTPAAAPSP